MFKIWFGFIVLLFTFDSINAQKDSCIEINIGLSITSVFTPFKSNGELSLEEILPYAQYLKNKGVLEILVGGTIGEAFSMNLCDRIALIEAWVKVAGPLGIGVMVQVQAGLPFGDTLTLVELCVKLKVKAIVLLSSCLYAPQTAEEFLLDLELIAGVSGDIPIILESVCVAPLPVSLLDIWIEASIRLGNCFGGAITDLNTAVSVQALVPSIDGKVLIISGHEPITAALQLKLTTINSVSNYFPELVLGIVAAIQVGDIELANLLQAELDLKVGVIIGTTGDRCIRAQSRDFIVNQKAALALIAGLKISVPRLPLLPAVLEVVDIYKNS